MKMTYAAIEVERHGPVAVLRLNDPASLNAVTRAMIGEINVALDDIAQGSRAMILTGAGRGFCSGANLASGLIDASAGAPASILETHINPLMRRLRDLPLPWVAAVNGSAAGVGCSFALAADIVICSERAFFLQAFARIGLVPDGGSSWLLPRSMTRARAMEMMLLADRLPAAKALEWGMVNHVVADDQLASVSLEIASRLAAGPTRSLTMIRRLAWQAASASFDEALALECDHQRIARATGDHREGVDAFLAKRAPDFTGT